MAQSKRLKPNNELYASNELVSSRVDEIYEIMVVGKWKPGVDTKLYADNWQVSESRIKQMAAEAWRRVCWEANNPDEMRPEIAGILRKNLLKADEMGALSSVAKLADTFSKVIGARAPERHEHAVIHAQFEQLPKAGKIKWIDERILKLQEAREALEESEDEDS